MKRLFGTIGSTYLAVLAVAFFLPKSAVFLLAAGFVITGCGIVLAVKRFETGKTMLLAGISAALAVVSIFLYRNYIYQPVVDNFSDKEISFKGYICDEINIGSKIIVIPLQTEEINGEKAEVKINLTVYNDFEAEEFDCVEGRLFVSAHESENLISKGCFLSASQDNSFELRTTGEKHFSLYSIAVNVRMKCKSALTKLLNRDSGALCKAILLGDKYGLRKTYKHDFQRTGTSFLIVVSGMHLSVLCGLINILLKRTKISRLPRLIIFLVVVIGFSAVTGFTRSVMRAGIMVILAYCGDVVHRKVDSINSLGIAALILALPNPFVVGDLGVLMSFSTTLGIVLWAPKIIGFLTRVLHICSVKLKPLRWILNFIVNLIAVSVSAALWVMPILTLFIGRIPLLVVPVSIITSLIASLILILSVIMLALYFIPFISVLAKPIALLLNVLCGAHLNINSFVASIPFSSVKTEKLYYFIWLGVTCALVAVGYLIHAKKKYVVASILISAFVLGTGWSVQVLTDTHPTEIYLKQTYRGLTAGVSKDGSLSILCCGGNGRYNDDVIDDLYAYNSVIDNAVIPNRVNYSSYLTMLEEHFDLKNTIVNQKYADEISEDADFELSENSRISFVLNSGTVDEVMNIDGIVYQYLTIESRTLLFVPHYGDIEKLPVKYRTADYIIMDYVSYHAELLSCHTLIYTGQQNKRYDKNAELLGEISDKLILLKNKTYIFKIQEGR